MPSPFPISVICFQEEYMIQFFHRSHTKTPESGHFSDWIGNNTDDLRCSDWSKRRHPLVVFDNSLHFCLRNEQWIHTRVRNEISAGSVFLNLNLKNALIEVSSIEIFYISSYTKTVAVKTSLIIWMQFDTGYKLQKRQTGSLFNSWMESWPGLTVIHPSEIMLRIILSDLRFHNTFQFVKYGASAQFFFSLLLAQNEVNEL